MTAGWSRSRSRRASRSISVPASTMLPGLPLVGSFVVAIVCGTPSPILTARASPAALPGDLAMAVGPLCPWHRNEYRPGRMTR